MRLSCQEDMIPGRTLAERIEVLSDLGIDAIEITDGVIKERGDEIEQALAGSSVALSTVCVKPSSKYTNILGLLDPDLKERERTVNEIKAILGMAARCGAAGVIVVPIFAKPRLPDLSPLYTAVELEEQLLVLLLKDLVGHAAKVGTMIFLEPVHRYLTHFLTTFAHGARICDQVGHKNLGIMVDVFQSLNEERDVMDSIETHAQHIGHFHLSDNNRLLPGLGTTDFTRFFRVLGKIQYGGYLALECTRPENVEEFRQCVSYLRKCEAEAR